MEGVVYKYTSPSGKVYIGQTSNEKRRRSEFLRISQSYGGSKMDNARLKYGVENFLYEVLFRKNFDDLEVMANTLNEKEMYYIKLFDSFRNGYNMNKGGAGNVGFEMTKESRLKISENTKQTIREKGHPMSGRKHSEESIKKMRENTKKKFGKENPNYGWNPPRELIDRLSELSRMRVGDKNPFFGKHHTDENKEKYRKLFGKKVVQIDKLTGNVIAIYDSANEAALSVCGNLKAASDIGKCCNGYVNKNGVKIKTAKGYKWQWYQQFKEKGSSTIESIGIGRINE